MRQIKNLVIYPLVITVILWVGYPLIFILPYYVPMKPVFSDSYVLGFNNSIAVFSTLFILFLIAASTNVLLNKRDDRTQRIFDINSGRFLAPVSKPLLTFIFIYISASVFGYLLLKGPFYFCDGTYFIDRMYTFLMGLKPYTQFEFAYGPFLILAPSYLAKFLSMFFLSTRFAYYVFLTFTSICGLFMLAYIIDILALDEKGKVLLFCVIAVISWNPSFGVQYTLFRYLAPFFALAFLFRYFNVPFSSKKTYSLVESSLFVFFLEALCVSISPEVGLLGVFAVNLYLLLMAAFFNKKIFLTMICTLPLVIAFTMIMPAGYLRSIISFGSGSNNFPVVPSLPVLLYLFCLFLGSTVMTICETPINKKHRGFPFAISFLILSIALLPGAFGRSDPGHMMFYGLGLTMVTFTYIYNNLKPLFRIFFFFFILVNLTAYITGFYVSLAGPVLSTLYVNIGQRIIAPDKLLRYARFSGLDQNKISAFIKTELGHGNNELAKLDVYSSLGTPFMWNGDIKEYLYAHNKFVPEFFFNYINMATPDDVSKKIADIKRNRYLIIPEKDLTRNTQGLSNENKQGAYLSLLLLYPIKYTVRNHINDINKDVIGFIMNNYRKVDKVSGCIILKKVETPLRDTFDSRPAR
jgi:hypothetical protein